MFGYYESHLAAERLRQCYAIAPPAAQTYLRTEIEFVAEQLQGLSSALELGCGYGRVLAALAPDLTSLYGIDTSAVSLQMARQELAAGPCRLSAMNAAELGFKDSVFDAVICIQNGISAFGVEPLQLVREALRVTRSGGRVLLSSYAERFWDARLEWFEAQAAHGLIGKIDRRATGNGVIVCEDGFRATTFGPDDFRAMAAAIDLRATITEVAGASLFCILAAP